MYKVGSYPNKKLRCCFCRRFYRTDFWQISIPERDVQESKKRSRKPDNLLPFYRLFNTL